VSLIGSDSIRTDALLFCFDALSPREPVSAPDQVQGRLSLENVSLTAQLKVAVEAKAPAKAGGGFRDRAPPGSTGGRSLLLSGCSQGYARIVLIHPNEC
jgi:hypothetical protein